VPTPPGTHRLLRREENGAGKIGSGKGRRPRCDTVLATPDQLKKASVGIKVVEDTRGPKINGFTYKNKSNQRKRWGHRQAISRIEVTSIKAG